MFRIITILISVGCVAVVAAEVAGAAWLYARGYLEPDRLEAAYEAVQPVDPAEQEEIEIPEELAQVAKEEVVEKRAMAILELSARDRELQLLKTLVEQKSAQVTAAKKELEQMQGSFQDQLDAVEEDLLNDAAEQARGILLALQPADAVEKLMTLDPDEAIRLMRGIPEKSHAKILQEFQGADKTERGNEIFQAIVRGRPQTDIIRSAEETLSATK